MEKRIIINLARPFKRYVDGFLKKRLLLYDDFDAFQKVLIQNPEIGDVIVGTGGVRKVRLKSASRGKSGGFRVCYYYVTRSMRYTSYRYTPRMRKKI